MDEELRAELDAHPLPFSEFDDTARRTAVEVLLEIVVRRLAQDADTKRRLAAAVEVNVDALVFSDDRDAAFALNSWWREIANPATRTDFD